MQCILWDDRKVFVLLYEQTLPHTKAAKVIVKVKLVKLCWVAPKAIEEAITKHTITASVPYRISNQIKSKSTTSQVEDRISCKSVGLS